MAGFSSKNCAELFADDGLDDALHLARDELGLRLRIERRIGMLDRDDRGEAFANVFADEALLDVFEQVLRGAVGVERARERRRAGR